MPFLLIGLLTLILGVYLLRQLGRASPAQVAANIRSGGGVLAAIAASLVLLRGRFILALGLGGLAVYLFTGESVPWDKLKQFFRRAPASRTSRIRTDMLEMALDHASGEADGTVLNGVFAGMKLSEMSREELERLRADCAARDPDSVLLLDHYLDRRFARGGSAGQRDANAGRNGTWRRRDGEMSEEEAYQTLGLRPGAGADEIVRAHRRLMKERHPDHGGATDDAARLNQAKDRLMRRQG
ncbi:molecular chaperone DnaJ [Rhodoblastus sp.]|jgi:DnaJ-domain-containing protein 1|uniref:molecular chaperone DnaJ n=1 Tax=Rhodoblastus sp. TaxID=1962975 RepID=UPI002635CCBA|nr:molecular chaperone DnaJ [Rhodoblastus sp.]